MAFTWILGKRFEPVVNTSEDGDTVSLEEVMDENGGLNLAEINLSIEDGLLEVFGPDGDPVPPLLLKEACVRQPRATIRLPNGFAVDHKRLIDVIDAQLKSPLAERPTDRWIKAMLGAEGAFEPATDDHLASERIEEKRVRGNKLTVETPGGETITLCDAHPGNSCRVTPLSLLVDGKPVSIEALLDHAGKSLASEALSPVFIHRGEDVALLLHDDVEAKLEAASPFWGGEAKLDLFLSDGRQASIDDLIALLQEEPAPEDQPHQEEGAAGTYPLLSDEETPFDLARATIVMVSNMPDGWSLTKGIKSEQGAWMLDPSDLTGTSVECPGPPEEPSTLEINVISIVGHDGTLEKQTRSVVIPPQVSEETAKQVPARPQNDERPFVVRLAFDEAEICLAVSADALLLRGIPKGASLSAGVFDQSVGGWILKPSQLHDLVLHGLDGQSQSIELELKAIHLDREGQSRADVIGKKTIPIAA